MIIFYNIIQLLSLLVLFPLLLIVVIITPKYRGRITKRLGFGLQKTVDEISISDKDGGSKTIWVHALSVGEVLSSLSLVKALRIAFPQSTILFSASTKTGEELATLHLSAHVDRIIPFPFDIYWVVIRFIRILAPDLFILIETDFWPNFIHTLQKNKIKSLLANGRISRQSHNRYLKLRNIFGPLFSSFTATSMQTTADAKKIRQVGVPENKVLALGNLKYDSMLSGLNSKVPGDKNLFTHFNIDPQKMIFVTGSTHPGEEEIIISAFKELRNIFPELYLVIAPRQINRAGEIESIARRHKLTANLRSGQNINDAVNNEDILILNTIGELSDIYSICSIAFIGGSLVPEGGHNPLEAVIHRKAVFFGPYMDDFSEIADELLQCGGAITVEDKSALVQKVGAMLSDPVKISLQAEKATELVRRHQGVTEKHIELIKKILSIL